MMRISTKSDYGLQALMALAKKDPETFISLKKLSEEYKLPYRFLTQIMHTLKKADIVESREGVSGGYRLARKPEAISMGEVLSLFENDLGIMRCTTVNAFCPQAEVCPSRPAWHRIQDTISQSLLKMNLNDLLHA